MAPSQSLAIPSKEPLPHGLRLPSTHPSILKTLSKLSRSSVIQLAVEWCSSKNVANCGPFINNDFEPDDSDVLWTTHITVEEVASFYREEAARKGLKRELVDRVLEGDWRHGFSLQQLAMVECQILADHPDSLMWTAFQLNRYKDPEYAIRDGNDQIPNIHAPSFILALHQEILSLTKAHYHITRHASLDLTLIRIAMIDTPYSSFETTMKSDLTSTSKSIILAIPDGAPFIFVSLPGTQALKNMEAERSLLSYIIQAIPRAVSRPLERFEMRPTKLTARSLETLIAMRGATRESGVGGGWSSYASDDLQPKALELAINQLADKAGAEELDNGLIEEKSHEKVQKVPKRTFDHSDPTAHLPTQKQKRLKEIASGRFGKVGTLADKKALHRFDVAINDPVKGNPGWSPSIQMSFQGTHVFAGLRKLAESGVIDASKMPGWMSGEAASSVGVVKDGRIARWDDDVDD